MQVSSSPVVPPHPPLRRGRGEDFPRRHRGFMTPEPHLRGHIAFHAASASRERGRPAGPPVVPPPAALYSAISSSTVTAHANGAFQLIAISLVDHDSM